MNLSTLYDSSVLVVGTFKRMMRISCSLAYLVAYLCLYPLTSYAASVDSNEMAVTAKDFLGRDIRLQKPARRIVALAPHIVENLFSAGAGEYIVGAVDYCDYPEAAKKIPRVGAISRFSVEAIISTTPDLVIVWASGRGGEIIEKLERLGIPTYANNPSTLVDVARSIRDYGKLMGTGQIADHAATRYENTLQSLRKRYEHRATVSAFYQVWNDPIQTLNGESIISDVLRLCGAHNVFSKAVPLAPKVSVESIITLDPEAIIASGMGEARPDWLDHWKKWKGLQAVRQDNLFFVHPDIIQRHTMRILDGASEICRQMDRVRKKSKHSSEK